MNPYMHWAPFHYRPLDEWFMGMFDTLPEPSDEDLTRIEEAIAEERRGPKRKPLFVHPSQDPDWK